MENRSGEDFSVRDAADFGNEQGHRDRMIDIRRGFFTFPALIAVLWRGKIDSAEDQ